MRSADFDRAAQQESGEFRQLLFRYTTALFAQLAQQALCNQLHTIAPRCARWLLLTQDGVNRAAFLLTQEFLAYMLGGRRASVTVVARRLQQDGLIRYQQGVITVLDHSGLEACKLRALGGHQGGIRPSAWGRVRS